MLCVCRPRVVFLVFCCCVVFAVPMFLYHVLFLWLYVNSRSGLLILTVHDVEVAFTAKAQQPKEEDRLVVPQRAGLAVVHPGDLKHEVEPITAGERFNLVFWLKERPSR